MGRQQQVTITDALAFQFDAVVDQLQSTIEMIPEDQWVTGDSRRHTPVRQAVHILAAFERYADRFVHGSSSWEKRWGRLLSGFGRKIPVEELPDRTDVIQYCDDVRHKLHR